MIDTLNVGSYFYSNLSPIPNVTKVYPIVADNDAKFPFIVYKRTNIVSNGCKDGYYEDVAVVQISIVTEKYKEGVEIANAARKALECPTSRQFGDHTVSECMLTAANEDYNNAYVQTMQFTLKIN